VTRAAIHLIETGKARPSMHTLELIASVTGKPLSFFLADGGRPSRRRLHLGAPDRGLDPVSYTHLTLPTKA